jgi:hypothetical protein
VVKTVDLPPPNTDLKRTVSTALGSLEKAFVAVSQFCPWATKIFLQPGELIGVGKRLARIYAGACLISEIPTSA